ncbi:hypothetical protein HaLaN_26164, partial [Haematococcus lacustris]
MAAPPAANGQLHVANGNCQPLLAEVGLTNSDLAAMAQAGHLPSDSSLRPVGGHSWQGPAAATPQGAEGRSHVQHTAGTSSRDAELQQELDGEYEEGLQPGGHSRRETDALNE